MNKKIIVLVLSLLVIFCGIYFAKKNPKSKDHFVIGVLQTASFPALDEARDGFIAKIKKELGEDKVTLIVQNAEGSLTQAQAIASSFKANTSMNAFYAIATPAVEALKREVTKRPIVFAAVTDPVGLHLRDEKSNITGSTDMANISKQIQYISELLPNIKKVALLYNPGEPNSVTLVKMMKEELKKHNIEFIESGVNSEADVASATEQAVASAQLILIPTDNTVTAAFPIVKQIASRAHVPIVVTWTGEKEQPLMQFGVNYIHSGEQAAEMMQQILVDKKIPMAVPIMSPTSQVLLSKNELEKFKVKVPESLKNIVTVY